VNSAASLLTFANSSSVPIVVFVDMQQEYLAKPRLLAISEIDRALDNCRKVLDHSRSIGQPQSRARRHPGGRNSPRHLEDIWSLWRGI
jgi:hypothetical protein